MNRMESLALETVAPSAGQNAEAPSRSRVAGENVKRYRQSGS